MNAEQLALWLQGMMEYRNIDTISAEEARKMLQGIKDHVALVFNKVTPKIDTPSEPKKGEVKAVPVESEQDARLKKIFKDLGKKPIEQTPWPYSPPVRLPYEYDKERYWLDRQPGGLGVITC